MYKYVEKLLSNFSNLGKCKENIENAIFIIKNKFVSGGKLIVSGNGGSYCDALHISGELLKEFSIKRPIDEKIKIEAINLFGKDGKFLAENLQKALPVTVIGNMALMTAFANDAEPMLCFAQEVYASACENDVFLCFSTSGNSKNIYYGAMAAKLKGAQVILMTGNRQGKIEKLADVSICVPESETYRIQELHLPVYHTICLEIEEFFYGKPDSRD